MKKTIIITIIVCLALAPFMFGDMTKHTIGTEQGDGNARPLKDIDTYIDTSIIETPKSGLSKTEPISDNDLTDCPIVVFIVSIEKSGEINGMNSTTIICHTMSVGDGEHYIWRGVNRGWANPNHLYYSIEAFGNSNGIISVKANEYMLGKKTNRPVYVRQIIGIRSEAYE